MPGRFKKGGLPGAIMVLIATLKALDQWCWNRRSLKRPVIEFTAYDVNNDQKKDGTRGRTRTGTLLRAGDFESPVSTNFTTLAWVNYVVSTLFRSAIIAVVFA